MALQLPILLLALLSLVQAAPLVPEHHGKHLLPHFLRDDDTDAHHKEEELPQELIDEIKLLAVKHQKNISVNVPHGVRLNGEHHVTLHPHNGSKIHLSERQFQKLLQAWKIKSSIKKAFKTAFKGIASVYKTTANEVNAGLSAAQRVTMDVAKQATAQAQAAWSALASAFLAMEFTIPGFDVCCSETIEPASKKTTGDATMLLAANSTCEATLTSCVIVQSGSVKISLLPPGMTLKLRPNLGVEMAIDCVGYESEYEVSKEVTLFNVYGVEGAVNAGFTVTSAIQASGSVSMTLPLSVKVRTIGSPPLPFVFLPPTISLGTPRFEVGFAAAGEVSAAISIGAEVVALGIATLGIGGEVAGTVTLESGGGLPSAGMTVAASFSGAVGVETPDLSFPYAFCGEEYSFNKFNLGGIGTEFTIFSKEFSISLGAMSSTRTTNLWQKHDLLMIAKRQRMVKYTNLMLSAPDNRASFPHLIAKDHASVVSNKTLPAPKEATRNKEANANKVASVAQNRTLALSSYTYIDFEFRTSGTCPYGTISYAECEETQKNGQACSNSWGNDCGDYGSRTKSSRPLGCFLNDGGNVRFNLFSGTSDCSADYVCLCKKSATSYTTQSGALNQQVRPSVPMFARKDGHCTEFISLSECEEMHELRGYTGGYEIVGAEEYPYGCVEKLGTDGVPQLYYNAYQSTTQCSDTYGCVCSEPPLQIIEVTEGTMCTGTSALDRYDCRRHVKLNDELHFNDRATSTIFPGTGCIAEPERTSTYLTTNGLTQYSFVWQTTSVHCSEANPCVCRDDGVLGVATQSGTGIEDSSTQAPGLFSGDELVGGTPLTMEQDSVVTIANGRCAATEHLTEDQCRTLASEKGVTFESGSYTLRPSGCWQSKAGVFSENKESIVFYNTYTNDDGAMDNGQECHNVLEVTSGTKNEWKHLTTAAECEEAAGELGYASDAGWVATTYAGTTTSSSLPPYCVKVVSGTSSYVTFNQNTASSVSCSASEVCIIKSWMGPCYCKDEAPRSCYFVGGKMGLYDAVRRLQHYDSAAECAEAVLDMGETMGEWTYNGGTISYPIDGVAYTDGGMCYAISGLTSEYDDDSTDSDFRSATMQMCRINDCVFTTGGNTWGTSPFTQKEVLGNSVANRGECYSSCRSEYTWTDSVTYLNDGSCYCFEGLSLTDNFDSTRTDRESCVFA